MNNFSRINMYLLKLVLSILLFSLSKLTYAGVTFQHHDWELACDNTNTCRAAGYQPDNSPNPISMLLTRKAGVFTKIQGQIMLGDDQGKIHALTSEPFISLALDIDGANTGAVKIDMSSDIGSLSQKQVLRILKALRKDSLIKFVYKNLAYQISDQGASAVLLKMDEYQGRINTPGAIVRKGKRSEHSVKLQLPVPTIKAAALPMPKPRDKEFLATYQTRLKAELLVTLPEDEVCTGLINQEKRMVVFRLNQNKLLVSADCWLAAYNQGSGFWVINDAPPFKPLLVTLNGSDYGGGQIYAYHKGRGIGDCYSQEEWTWDGVRFIQTKISSTGMCKSIGAGGAWELPELVTNVKPSDNRAY